MTVETTEALMQHDITKVEPELKDVVDFVEKWKADEISRAQPVDPDIAPIYRAKAAGDKRLLAVREKLLKQIRTIGPGPDPRRVKLTWPLTQ